jgi:hypothetical protein
MILSRIVTEIVEELDIYCPPLQVVSCLEHCYRGGGTLESVFVPSIKAYFRVKIGQPTTLN